MSKRNDPISEYVTITPAMASAMLKRSSRKNVPVKEKKIQQYAIAMGTGKWDKYNSQAISVDWDHNIVNGHQRLMACIRADVPFETLLITGVPPETFMNEDTGRSRDAGHFFAMKGEKNCFVLAAGTRSLLLWEKGLWKAASSSAAAIYIPNSELEEELERRGSQLRPAANYYGNNAKIVKGRFSSGITVALWALTVGHEKHDAFWAELVERVGGSKTSAAWQLNHRIDLMHSRHSRLTPTATAALLTKAWNLYSTGEKKELVWYGQSKREPFPQPLTHRKPALLPPEGPDLAPVLDGTRRSPERNGTPEPKKKTKVKKVKGPKLRGGIGNAPAPR